jgi:two-component system, chemotaxis family, sensor kinase CheA
LSSIRGDHKLKLEFDDLIDEFVTEAIEHLGDVESLLLSLETGVPEESVESIQKVFRAVHSIKGTAGFVGLSQINLLAHAAENILDQMRSKELIATQDVINLLLKAIDSLRGLVRDARASNAARISQTFLHRPPNRLQN